MTHDGLLERIALPWICIVPSRQKMPGRDRPPHAEEPSPNVVVAALPTDRSALALCSQFRQKHWKPRFNEAHVPSDFAWQIITPDGDRLFLFTWVNWQRNSRRLFEEFCRETGRALGTLTHDGTIVLGTRSLSLRDCRLAHEDEFHERPVPAESHGTGEVLSKADRLLKCRKSKTEQLDYRAFVNDREAHDDDLQESLERTFLARMAAHEKALGGRFGPPVSAGADEHPDVPVNGVVRHALWRVGKKSLFLVVSHEDRELPWVLELGVLV